MMQHQSVEEENNSATVSLLSQILAHIARIWGYNAESVMTYNFMTGYKHTC